jgi:hypothetical protein
MDSDGLGQTWNGRWMKYAQEFPVCCFRKERILSDHHNREQRVAGGDSKGLVLHGLTVMAELIHHVVSLAV